MYVGLTLVLLGWAAFLSSAWALAGPVAFVLYIGRFQIAPEERTSPPSSERPTWSTLYG